MQRKISTIFLCLAVLLTVAVSHAANLTLARDGSSDYVIALAADATPAESTAAQELQDHLQKVSGVKLPIVPETGVAGTTRQILVGAGPRVKQLLAGQDWAALGSDGIVIKTSGKNLILAGARPRGSLYAVYTFLEDSLGVRWWTPTENTIPQNKNLRVEPREVVYAPKIQTREGYYTDLMRDPLFAARLKVNGHHQKQGPELGGHSSILGFVHTFDLLLPPEKYFKDHPEWYADPSNGGKPCTAASAMPGSQRSQLILSNDEMRRELTKNALELIRTNPAAGMISISQNDNDLRPTDDADLAIEKREGSPAGPFIEFVNKVAADIEKEFPGFLVETLAYKYTRTPPRTLRPRDNVVIRLCPMEANFSQPINSEANKAFRDEVLGWGKIAKRLYIWNYVTNFRNVILPHPNLRNLANDIRFFQDNNAIALFEQGDAYSNGTGDFVAMRVWVLSRLMWNPALNQRKLENEFLRGYYGAAAPHLRAYLDGIQAAFEKTRMPLSTFHTNYSYLTVDVLNDSLRHFRRAAAAVAKDPVLWSRVRRERLALDHAWILRYRPLQREVRQRKVKLDGPADLPSAIREFVKTAREYNVEQKAENQAFEPYAEQLLNMPTTPTPLPEFLRGKSEDDIIDGDEDQFRFSRLGDTRTNIDDPGALNQRAVKIVTRPAPGAVRLYLDENESFLKQGVWRWYLLARIEKRPGATSNFLITYGVEQPDNPAKKVTMTQNFDQLADGKFHVLDLGARPLTPQTWFWVAGPSDESIESLVIDRIVMVREPSTLK